MQVSIWFLFLGQVNGFNAVDKSFVNVQPKGKLSNDKNKSIVKTETGTSDLKENSFVFVLESRCFPYIRYAIQRDYPWEQTQNVQIQADR